VLTLTMLGALVGMTSLEWLKPLIWPSPPPWPSRVITVLCTALGATAAACVILRRYRQLHQQTSEEMTRRQRVEKALRASQERYRTLFNNVPVGLYRNTVLPEGAMTMANPAIVRMFGYSSVDEFTEVDGDAFFINPADRGAWEKKLLSQGKANAEQLLLKRKDGTPFWAAITAGAIRNQAGEIEYIDGFIQDITQQKLAEQQLEEANRQLEILATTDGLTGLLNRRTLFERLEEEVRRCRRSGRPLAAVLMDIDRFKAVNDRYGHQAGDLVLVRFAQLLRENSRPYDLVARYGGDEFILVLLEADAERARSAAERLRDRLAHNPMMLESAEELIITASFGVAEGGPEPGETIEAIVGRADEALYQGKEQGRDRVVVAAASIHGGQPSSDQATVPA